MNKLPIRFSKDTCCICSQGDIIGDNIDVAHDETLPLCVPPVNFVSLATKKYSSVLG